jgi:hypothetical protein
MITPFRRGMPWTSSNDTEQDSGAGPGLPERVDANIEQAQA